MFAPPPAVRPFLLAMCLLALGVYLFFGGLALVQARAAAVWAIALVPLALLCFVAAGLEARRVARSVR